ncbi:MAG: DUF255 domain-containing protein [Planctomycetes bacterium]|nr:DUF255 domain-containing protein [Planctomycetota bacterium]
MTHGDAPRHTNHLVHETSPYLLQHAHNPVDWRPWGRDAFDLARREDKPIFLSVGYSTCHWCHVMAHQSFEDEEVAAIMNAHFVNIKVDREELPDVDEQYMLATQLFTQRGGWPNSVILTPDGRPWYAGTYYPKAQFMQLLASLAAAWRDQRPQVREQADNFATAIRQAGSRRGSDDQTALEPTILADALAYFRRAYDEKRGGFGGAPKFPPHGALALFNFTQTQSPNLDDQAILTQTLDAMMRGGLYDHVGGGFHRYSTDSRWFLPHFEKMLYDNAQLIRAYTDAYALTRHEPYRRVVAETFGWIERRMTDPAGGFYSALDADSEGEEGKYYLWRYDELVDLLGETDGKRFAETYGATPAGNYYEEATRHHTGTNHLFLPQPAADASQFDAMRLKLRTVRDQRVPPHLDDKVLASWNALLIGSLAHAGKVLGERRYTDAANRAADFIFKHMMRDGDLRRTWRKGEAKLPAYLDDYAYLVSALLDLHEATGDAPRLDQARMLAERMIERFYDPRDGGFYFTQAEHDKLLLRSKEIGAGGNMPSGNGIAAAAMTRLAILDDDLRLSGLARQTLEVSAGLMATQPHGTEGLILAYARYHAAAAKLPTAGANALVISEPIVAALFGVPDTIQPGERFDITVKIAVAPGWHVYAHDDEATDHIGLALAAGEDAGFVVSDVQYPAGEAMLDPFTKQSIMTCRGRCAIRATAAAPGTIGEVLPLRLTVQACGEERCLEPRTLKFDAPLR